MFQTRLKILHLCLAVALLLVAGAAVLMNSSTAAGQGNSNSQDPVVANAERLITEGRETFRFDTFGSEAFWGGQLHLHEAIEGAAAGGAGPGITARTALNVGLKVDVDA